MRAFSPIYIYICFLTLHLTRKSTGSDLYLIFRTGQRKEHTKSVTMNDKVDENTVEDGAAPPHSLFSKLEKGIYIYIASLAAFASPISSSIYYPAMSTLATDLHTSLTNISLTITTYMVIPTSK